MAGLNAGQEMMLVPGELPSPPGAEQVCHLQANGNGRGWGFRWHAAAVAADAEVTVLRFL